MITWMQRHNKYLVWTIWIATIAFIGAGFVGWGRYNYGSKASAVGKVGDIEISKERLNFTYSNLYNRYNDLFKGKFDEEQARKMGLVKQAFGSLASQAQLLNLAKQYGITVSEKELADYIASMRSFQEGGVFSKKVYKTYLQNRRIKSSTFESILSDELTIKKLMEMIEINTLPFESKAVASALSIEDKIKYKILSKKDVNPQIDNETLRKEWESTKDQYLTPRAYKMTIYWTDTKDINATDADVRDFYEKNSFDYIDAAGKQLDFDQVKSRVETDYKVKKGKKKALIDYIAVKKGKIDTGENKTLNINDPYISAELWKEISKSPASTLLKPKPVGDRYATVKIESVVEPKPMTFEEARSSVRQKLISSKVVELMEKKAKEILDNIDKADLTESDYLSLSKPATLTPLSQRDSLQFLEKLFTVSGKQGIIRLSKNLVVYSIVDQRINSADDNLTASVENEANKIKKSVFERALFEDLNKKFPVRAYAKGL